MKLTKAQIKHITLLAIVVLSSFGVATTTFKQDSKYFEISKNIEIFTNLYKEINTFYVDDLDPSKLMITGVDAMLESLDPYTNYIAESEIEKFTMTVRGRYSGIGASINKLPGDIHPFITDPYEGFPAQKAGVRAGDILLEVDGKSTTGKSTNNVSEVLRGSTGSDIELKLRRPITGEEYSVTLQRGEVKIPNVPYHGMLDDKIGYINLTTFTEQAGKNVENAFRDLKTKNPNMTGVILDLRGNGGGLLIEAVNLVNVFIPRSELVVATRGKIKDWDRNFNTLNSPVDLEMPLAVLIDDGSASASEIVSGVLQDLDRGVLVGQKSYGKGLVQNTRDVGFNSRVKMTTAKYYIPSGRCIQAVSYKNGLPIEIPDSLKAVFKTKNGREVLDGGGIYPDAKVKAKAKAEAINMLGKKNLIFDFATQYASKHGSISASREFSLTDADYNEFVSFVQKSDFSYQTKSEKALANLEKQAKGENYLGALQVEIEAMKKKIVQDKANDLYKYKREIKDLLEREIASRYYYEKGKIQVGLKNDDDVKEAIRILNNDAEYHKLLSN